MGQGVKLVVRVGRKRRRYLWATSPKRWKRLTGGWGKYGILQPSDPPDGWWKEEGNWRELEEVMVALMVGQEEQRLDGERLRAKLGEEMDRLNKWMVKRRSEEHRWQLRQNKLEEVLTRSYYRLQQAYQAKARGELMLDTAQLQRWVQRAAKHQKKLMQWHKEQGHTINHAPSQQSV